MRGAKMCEIQVFYITEAGATMIGYHYLPANHGSHELSRALSAMIIKAERKASEEELGEIISVLMHKNYFSP